MKTYNWPVSESVKAAFFGRKGGVSQGPYAGLNCGVGSGDNPAHVKKNRAIAAQALGVSNENLLALYQVHGNECMTVTERWRMGKRPKADAAVTDVKGLALSVLTADCAPVLFEGDNGGIIGAAHAGWKGALGGVLESTVQAMNIAPDKIRACIGPCIAKRSYEVDAVFFKQFVEACEDYERFFHGSSKPEHYYFDLAGFCALRLFDAGLRDVTIAGMDTYADEEIFYSYRRATHRGERDYGRQLSGIVIR